MSPDAFAWLRGLSGGKGGDASAPEAGDARAVSVADMVRLGWITDLQAEEASKALDELKAVIQKSGWKLTPQFRKEAVVFGAPDAKVPFVITFRKGQVGFFICVEGIEDPVAVAEIPREFTEELGGGRYRGLVLGGRGANLQRYVSVLANSVRFGKCIE